MSVLLTSLTYEFKDNLYRLLAKLGIYVYCCLPCWRSSSSTVTPAVSTNNVVVRPYTTNRIEVQPSSSSVRNTPAISTQAVAISILSSNQAGSNSSVRLILDGTKVYPSFNLSESLILLVVSHLSFRECARIKRISHLWDFILKSENYLKIHTQSFHRITCYVQEIFELMVERGTVYYDDRYILVSTCLTFKVDFLIKSLIEICNVQPTHTPKLHWLLWNLQRQGDSYGIPKAQEGLDLFIKKRKIVPRADLKLFYRRRFGCSQIKLINKLFAFYKSFKNFTWDSLSILIAINYLDPLSKYCSEELINILADSMTQQCVKENHTDNWSEFSSNLFTNDKLSKGLGFKICRRVFSNLEKLKNRSGDDFEISNDRLKDLFRPHSKTIELFCNLRPYTNKDLLLIKNRVQKLERVILHYPSFSPAAIQEFFSPYRSFSLDATKEYFPLKGIYVEVYYEDAYLRDILFYLDPPMSRVSISTLKIKKTDFSTLQNWKLKGVSVSRIFCCGRILIEDVVNSEEERNTWKKCLGAVGFIGFFDLGELKFVDVPTTN